MKIKAEQLSDKGYRHFATLDHQELALFLRPYLFKLNPFVIAYNLATFLPLVLFVFLVGLKLGNERFDFEVFTYFFYGFTLAFLLVPLHEVIHGMAYKMVGAGKITYGASFKKFVFFAAADKFVTNSKEFRIVALAPFVLISLAALVLYFLLDMYWSNTMLGLLFVHSLFCGGDFGLLSYFYEHKDKELVIYDDLDSKVSYFYERG